MLQEIKDTIQMGLKIAEKFKDLELKEIILNLKTRILELEEEKLNLKTETHELKQKLEDKNKYNLIFKNNSYWNTQKNGEEGPFCSACWDNNKKTIRLKKYGDVHQCPVCKNIYEIY